MVRPAAFGYDPETAASNAFQEKSNHSPKATNALAQAEFDRMVEALRAAEIDVLVIEDSLSPAKPDAVFPNNWFSTHEEGQVVLYPMLSTSRRAERRQEVFDHLLAAGFEINEVLDLSSYEDRDWFLEGTGSMILDRKNRLSYACLGPRTHPELLETFASELDYETVAFHAEDRNGVAIYHTNVMMALGNGYAVICAEAIVENDRGRVLNQLRDTGFELCLLNFEQMAAFAGNMLEVQTKRGSRILVMSQQAHGALDQAQLELLQKHAELVPISVPHIEKVGGGSVRCMMAEVFLPGRD